MTNIKEKVLKDLFMIFPMEEADNLKYIRKSAEKIIETKYLGLKDIEKSIDLTLAEVGKEIDELGEKKHIININPNRFSTDEQRRVVELLMVKVSKDYQDDLEELKQKLRIK